MKSIRTWMVFLAGVGMWVAVGAQAASQVTDITSVVQRASGAVKLVGGRTVTLGAQQGLGLMSALDGGGRVEFEDLVPGANWSHPAKINVKASNGLLIESIDVNSPPEGVSISNAAAVTIRINDFGGRYRVQNPQKYFAVLINGAADRRHYNDFVFLLKTLKEIYGYQDSNILIADSNFIGSAPDMDGDGKADIRYESTKAGVRQILADAKSLMKQGDHVLVATNDHGNTSGGKSTLVLKDGNMFAEEFAAMTNAFPTNDVLQIHEPCFSGGFVRPTVGAQRVTMAAATNAQYSWASMDLNFDEFIYNVVVAFAMQTHDGKLVSADSDGDAKISAKEAFSYAVGKSGRPESPLLESGASGAMGTTRASEIGLSF